MIQPRFVVFHKHNIGVHEARLFAERAVFLRQLLHRGSQRVHRLAQLLVFRLRLLQRLRQLGLFPRHALQLRQLCVRVILALIRGALRRLHARVEALDLAVLFVDCGLRLGQRLRQQIILLLHAVQRRLALRQLCLPHAHFRAPRPRGDKLIHAQPQKQRRQHADNQQRRRCPP